MKISHLFSLVKQRKSVPVIILTLFWVGYSALNLYEYFYMTETVFEQENKSRLMRIEFHTENAISYLVNQQVEPLMEMLDKARQMKQFDFFLLKKGDQVITFGNQTRNLASIDQNYTDYGALLDDGKALFRTIKIEDYSLTIGSHKALAPRFFAQLDSRKWILLSDIVGVGLLVLLIALFSLKDIRKLSFALEQGDRAELRGISSFSREGQALLSTTVGLHESQENLKSENYVISKTIGPAILDELKQNNKAPYTFSATLVRVDLNGYTQLFLEKNVDYITKVLNIYFQKAHDIIERYHGKVYQYVGDEIVFLIKDNKLYNSQLMAMSAIRSLFQEAQNIENSLSKSEGHSFKLKASFSHGDLRFIKLDEGFAYSGLPLIESVRMLGAVKEKNENTLIFFSQDLEHVHEFCEPKEEISMVFKGFANEAKLIQVQKMHSISQILSSQNKIEDIIYFRSNIELAELFSHMEKLFQLQNGLALQNILKNLKGLMTKDISPELIESYKSLLKVSLQNSQKTESLNQSAASIIMLAVQIIQKEKFDDDLKTILMSAMSINENRIRANALEVLGHYFPDQDIYSEYLKLTPNRILANALYIEGKKKMKRYIRNRLEEMLASPDEHLVASSIWVIGELSQYYYTKDYASYLANPDLQFLIKKSNSFLTHENQMIRTRARITNEKIQSFKKAA